MIISIVQYGKTLVSLERYEGKAVEIREHKKTRTLEQNSYLWVVYKYIADFTGYTTEEVHSAMKYRFLPRTEVVIGETSASVPKSTKSLKTKEFNEFIERVVSFAASELSINIPPPTYNA
jgi:hypothetical protein